VEFVMTGKLPEERKACSRYGLSPICASHLRSIPSQDPQTVYCLAFAH